MYGIDFYDYKLYNSDTNVLKPKHFNYFIAKVPCGKPRRNTTMFSKNEFIAFKGADKMTCLLEKMLMKIDILISKFLCSEATEKIAELDKWRQCSIANENEFVNLRDSCRLYPSR